MKIPLFLLSFLSGAISINLRDRVISAVNCGGKEVQGAYGIVYSADTSESGVASDAGAAFSFSNAEEEDLEIYQTERWSKETFEYEVPITENGDYVIILKFSEVYFEKRGQKVFSIRINSKTVIKELDIFDKSGGRGFAHDVYIPITIKGKKITVNGQTKEFRGKVLIKFAKGAHDNPKVNGFVVLRGTFEGLPTPPTKHVPDHRITEDFDIYENEVEDSFRPEMIQNEEIEADEMFTATTTGSENPFEKESMDIVLPIVAAFIVIIPVVYVFQMRNNAQN